METSAMFVYRHGHQYDVSLPTAMSMLLISKTTEEVWQSLGRYIIFNQGQLREIATRTLKADISEPAAYARVSLHICRLNHIKQLNAGTLYDTTGRIDMATTKNEVPYYFLEHSWLYKLHGQQLEGTQKRTNEHAEKV